MPERRKQPPKSEPRSEPPKTVEEFYAGSDELKMPSAVFAEEVKAAMKRKGWTQQDLATALWITGADVDRTTVAKITAAGRKYITIEELLSFALALGVQPLSLIIPRSGSFARITDRHRFDSISALAWLRGSMRLPLFPEDNDKFRFDSDNEDDEKDFLVRSDPDDERFFHDSLTDLEAAAVRNHPAVRELWRLANDALGPAAFTAPSADQHLEEVLTEIVDVAQAELRQIKRRQSKKEKN
jgi:transcriptional regulator with XRE-family HTH domain